MSPKQGALCCFLVCSVLLAGQAAGAIEKDAALLAQAALTMAILREVGRQVADKVWAAGSESVSWYVEMVAVLAFLAQIAAESYRFLVLR